MTSRHKVRSLWVSVLVLGVLATSLTVAAYSGNAEKVVVVEGDYIESPSAGPAIGGVTAEEEFFLHPVVLEEGHKSGSRIFDVSSATFANATTTLCAIQNTSGADRFVYSPLSVISTAATTTATWVFATSTTPYADGAGTAVVSEQISTSTKAVIGISNANDNPGIANGSFVWGDDEYVLMTVTTPSNATDGAFSETTETVDGYCALKYLEP